MLSSATDAIIHGMFSFQDRSVTLAVWPPWINCGRCVCVWGMCVFVCVCVRIVTSERGG